MWAITQTPHLTKKSTKRKRQLRAPASVHPSDVRMARRMMPYS
ncbi:MAG: 50S ribosomal protein L35 [Methylococcales bacterium]